MRRTTSVLATALVQLTIMLCLAASDASASHHQGRIDAWRIHDHLTEEHFQDVDVISPTDAWAVGNGGTIQRWDGRSWSAYISPTDAHLYGITMIDARTGWAVGDRGTVLRWDGQQWASIDAPVDVALLSVTATRSGQVWISGDEGAVLRWDGRDLTRVETSTTEPLRDISFSSEIDGWTVSTDGSAFRWNGVAWTPVQLPGVFGALSVSSVAPDDVWLVGYSGRIGHWNGEAVREVPSPTRLNLQDVTMTHASFGWAVGDSGTILRWNGYEWIEGGSPTNRLLKSVDGVGTAVAWVVGANGMALYYRPVTGLLLPMLFKEGPSSFSSSAVADRELPARQIQSVTHADRAAANGPADQDPETLEATIFSRSLTWNTTPRVRTFLELHRSGELQARGDNLAGDTGSTQIWLEPLAPVDDLRADPFVYIRPADKIVLASEARPPITITVPTFTVDVDADTDRVIGTAPPGATVEVVVEDRDQPAFTLTREATSQESGRFEVDLTGVMDLLPGHFGTAAILTSEGHRFTAAFAVSEVEITLGSSGLRGRGSPGTRIDVAWRAADGSLAGQDGLEILGDPDWQLPYPAAASRFQPLMAGDRITVTRSGGPRRAADSMSLVVPGLTLGVDEARDVVQGSGPISTTLAVRLTPPGGAPGTRRVDSDASGRFRLELSGELDVGPGWLVEVIHDAGGGLRIRAREVLAQARVWVHDRTVSGIAARGMRVQALLRSPSGQRKGTAGAVAESDGSFHLTLSADSDLPPPSIDPGDVVEVEFIEGDPLVFRVPELTARTDPDAETVSGRAPAGSRVQVTASWLDEPVVRSVTADGDGDYLADFAGVLDIEPPPLATDRRSGTVVVPAQGRHVFLTGWAVVQIGVSSPRDRGGTVGVTAAHGRRVELTARDASGQLFFHASGRTGSPRREGDRTGWGAELLEAGQAVPLEAGDIVRAVVGEDSASFEVPPLEAVIHVTENRISGRTAPGVRLSIQAYGSLTSDPIVVELVSDDLGGFDHDFGDAFELTYNSAAWITAYVGRHFVEFRLVGPGLSLDLDLATVTGSVEPGVGVTVTLLAGSRTRAVATTLTDIDGIFHAALLGEDGEPVSPAPGDRLAVWAPAAASASELSMTVPEFTIEPDPQANAARGRATPGGWVGLSARDMFPWPAWGEENQGGGIPTVRADGSYALSFAPGAAIEPGWRIEGSYRLPVGHVARRVRHVPIVNVAHGGARVCGFGEPGAVVRIEARDATGSVYGQAETVIERDGTYDSTLRDPAGTPVVTRAGSTVQAQFGAESATLEMPLLEVSVDWDRSRISGTLPPDSRWSVVGPVSSCFDPDAVGVAGMTGADGRFEDARFVHDRPGDGVEVALRTEAGHRIYRRIHRILPRIFVHRDRVAGIGTPFDDLALDLYTSDGSLRARARTVVGADGHFDARFTDEAGRPISIQPGDELRVGATHESPIVPIEDLDFDFDASRGLFGRAQPGREVDIEMTLHDGRSLALTRQADEDGWFWYTSDDILSRATWTLEDIVHVRLVLRSPNGHEIVAESDVALDPPPVTIHLPLLTTRR